MESAFWIVRYVVLGISLVVALSCIVIIIRKALTKRPLMLYILVMSAC